MAKTTNPTKMAGGTTDVEEDADFVSVIKFFDGDESIAVGRMFGSTGLKANGKVFAMMVKGRFVVKLPKARVDEIVKSGIGNYFDPGHGKLMKEWVSLSGASETWVELANEAKGFVGRIK